MLLVNLFGLDTFDKGFIVIISYSEHRVDRTVLTYIIHVTRKNPPAQKEVSIPLFQIDLKSRKAIYAQITDNFKRLIITGTLRPDDKVPSVRDLAQSITVNPNTVQKAYRELESQGYFYTVLGQGSFISTPEATESEKPSPEVEALYTQLTNITQELIFRGQKIEEIIKTIEKAQKETTHDSYI